MVCHLAARAVRVMIVGVVLAVMALAPQSGAFKVAPYTSDVPAAPLFGQFFAQDFRVGVITESFGTFNATLRMRGSPNFPERVHGELTPIGEAKLNNQRQTPLPHFQRTRGLEDDILSDLPFSMAAGTEKISTKRGGDGSSSSKSSTGESERPSLLVVDLHLQHSDAMQGTASVYYLPAELMALRAQREEMKEGSALPSATVDFEFRSEAAHMTGNPLSDVNVFAHVSSATVSMGGEGTTKQSPKELGEEKSHSITPATNQGGIIFRWITEHEFSAHVMVPLADEGSAATTRMERIWVYGYATPSNNIFKRERNEAPWYNKYMMIGLGLMGFLLQVVAGMAEGKKRAKEEADLEAKIKATEKAKLEAQLLEQDKNNSSNNKKRK
ncbi:hypothetical protein JKF63_02946 [Porcisia hertigi]|uniref:Uncharacterized protein n=1 Tax=Porcisia hertigi TaxID=2761500 RepID=A0A836I891_9TRYP|nr:hypothetical protein JKF63_02946 [Porcisia hertigi]